MKIATMLLVVVTAPIAAAGEEPVVLIDFDHREPADGWSMGLIGLSELTLPEGSAPASGGALKLIRSEDGPKASYLHRAVDVHDWRRFRALRFHAKVETDIPVAMRIIAIDDRRPRGVLKRFTLKPGDWRDVVLPLSEWRADNYDQRGDFAKVDRFLLRWEKGAGEVTLDDVWLVPGDRGERSCRPTVAERLALAFPDGGGRAVEGDHFVLLTDVRRLAGRDGKKLLRRLEEGLQVLTDELGLPGEVEEPVPFVVFEKEADYRAFFPRLGDHYGAGIDAPKADGFSVLGVSGSSWDRRQGWKRPVYVHEAMHSAIEQLLGLASNGNWIQEALASAVQVRVDPETLTVKDLVGGSVPWAELFADRRPGIARYPQLLSIVEYVAASHAEKLPALWAAVHESGRPVNESIPPEMAKALGKSLADLETDWRAWAEKRY
jgi:hypothetical protein